MKRELFSVRFFKGSDTSCANVAVRFLAVFNVGNLLYVYFERSSRFTVGVAYVVTACLTFTANIAYSRHINTSVFWIDFSLGWFCFGEKNARKSLLFKTSINNISFLFGKSNQKHARNTKNKKNCKKNEKRLAKGWEMLYNE